MDGVRKGSCGGSERGRTTVRWSSLNNAYDEPCREERQGGALGIDGVRRKKRKDHVEGAGRGGGRTMVR